MNLAYQVDINADIPVEAPAMTINRMCGSGLQAIVSAAQEIALGEANVILAGGIENMNQAPFLLPKGRYGYRMGFPDAKIVDMVYDGLWDAFNDYHMGVTTENIVERYGITREEQDEYAARGVEVVALPEIIDELVGVRPSAELALKKTSSTAADIAALIGYDRGTTER